MARPQTLAEKAKLNHQIELGVVVLDLSTLISIFFFFLKRTWHATLEASFKFALFPLAALFNIGRAVLAWRQVYLERNEVTGKYKSNLILRAAVETLAAAAITTAVIGGLAFTTAFSAISPIIFAATMASKTAYHATAAFYYWGRSLIASGDNKTLFKNIAANNTVAALSSGLTTTGIVGVMLLGKAILAPLVIAAGVIGTSFAIFRLYQSCQQQHGNDSLIISEPQNLADEKDQHTSTLTNNARLHQDLGVKPHSNANTLEIIIESDQKNKSSIEQQAVPVNAPVFDSNTKEEDIGRFVVTR